MLGTGTSVRLGRGSIGHPKPLSWAGGAFLARLGADRSSRGWGSGKGCQAVPAVPGLAGLGTFPTQGNLRCFW